MSVSLRELSEIDFDAVVTGGLWLVEFGAAWCAPCRAMLPVLGGLAAELAGRVGFAQVDVDAHPALGQRFMIRALPTMIVFQDGRPIDQITGAVPVAKLRAKLAARLPEARDARP